MVKYTIAVCNYNMANTLERSLRSILDQIDDRFEVLVIDDSSTDSSIRILKKLENKYENLRLVIENNDNIGEARNSSVEKARGKYILTQLDVDDEYSKGILDFVGVFHQIEDQVDFDFYLKGNSINMAKKELLLEIPYRSMKRGEDFDLWVRLFDQNSIIWIDHCPFYKKIGYKPNGAKKIRITFESLTSRFRWGGLLLEFR